MITGMKGTLKGYRSIFYSVFGRHTNPRTIQHMDNDVGLHRGFDKQYRNAQNAYACMIEFKVRGVERM